MDTQDRRHAGGKGEEIASVETTKPVIDTFGMLVFFIVVAEIILVIGLNLYQKSRINTLSDQLQTTRTALAAPDNATINSQVNEVLDGSDQLKAVLSQKTRWSKFYTLLNAVTPKNVKVTGLSIADTGAFRAEGSTGTLTDLAALMVAWRQGTSDIATPFSAVNLSSNGFSDQNGHRVVTFSISGQVNTGVLQ